MDRHDVVIIGAGPAGSSLAAGLAKLGWDVVLVERHRLPRHKVCGEFLSPEAQTSLRQLGLYQVVAGLSPVVIGRARLVSRTGIRLPVPLPGPAWGVSRFALDAALATAAQTSGAELRSGCTATSIAPAGEDFDVTLRAGSLSPVIRARAVIAACGRYSLPGLPPTTSSRSESYVGLKCHYEAVSMPVQVELYFFPGGYVGVSPVEGGQVNICLLISRPALSRAGKDIHSVLDQAACQNPELKRRLAGGHSLPETEAAIAPVDLNRPASPWDGLACLGDTAVMIPPFCGDGMAMALRSAELCMPLAHGFLQGRLTRPEWQAAYSTAWHAAFDRPVRIARYLQTILNAPLLSDAFLGLGQLIPPLAAALVRATRESRPL
jgi:flavin-dependent dehydrogenase